MVISIDDWIFEVDLEQTVAYSKRIVSDHCQCGYCRNFYGAVDETYPQLRRFLARFGVDVEGPDELMPFEPTLYEATFCICGTILHKGSGPMQLQGFDLTVLSSDALDFETECPSPSFALTTTYLELPWILDEDINEVVSPANEPEYLQRMWNKLLTGAPEEHIFS